MGGDAGRIYEREIRAQGESKCKASANTEDMLDTHTLMHTWCTLSNHTCLHRLPSKTIGKDKCQHPKSSHFELLLIVWRSRYVYTHPNNPTLAQNHGVYLVSPNHCNHNHIRTQQQSSYNQGCRVKRKAMYVQCTHQTPWWCVHVVLVTHNRYPQVTNPSLMPRCFLFLLLSSSIIKSLVICPHCQIHGSSSDRPWQ